MFRISNFLQFPNKKQIKLSFVIKRVFCSKNGGFAVFSLKMPLDIGLMENPLEHAYQLPTRCHVTPEFHLNTLIRCARLLDSLEYDIYIYIFFFQFQCFHKSVILFSQDFHVVNFASFATLDFVVLLLPKLENCISTCDAEASSSILQNPVLQTMQKNGLSSRYSSLCEKIGEIVL